MHILIVVIGVAVLLFNTCGSNRMGAQNNQNSVVLSEISQSFSNSVHRYFQREHGKDDLRVETDLLRAGGTETGIAFPKYYAWVRVFDHQEFVQEGAIRVARVEENLYEVTHFVSVDKIRENPQETFQIFP